MRKHNYILFLLPFLLFLYSCSPEPDAPASTSTVGTTETAEEFTAREFIVDTRMGQSTTDPFVDRDRAIRVLVSYNDTNFFIADGRPRGLEFELMQNYAKFINKGKVQANQKNHVVFIPVPFSQLLPLLLDGSGDIAAAGLTVTDSREAKVAFTTPYRTKVQEVLVRSKTSKSVSSTNQLSGKKIYVVQGSSYAAHLKELNEYFSKQGIKPVEIIPADQSLAAEDLLQMINADILQYTVVDDHVASVWSQVLDGILVENQVSIHKGGAIAWAVRKDNTKLLASLNRFIKKNKQGTLLGNMLFKRYYKNTQWVGNPLVSEYTDKLHKLRPLFEKYGEKYGFDWTLLAALAFQESRFNQKRKSSAGAVGIMQIKPSTAGDKNVAIKGVANSTENNIHAATKYLAFIRDRYFSATEISAGAKIDFTLAAYNAGPRRFQSLRDQAAEAGLDPDRWFFNVENIAQKKIGRETVDYVANINKYKITFDAMERLLEARAAAVESLQDKP